MNGPALGGWARVSHQAPCPICGQEKWCLVNGTRSTVQCMRQESQKPSPVRMGGWLHDLPPETVRTKGVETLLPQSYRGGTADPDTRNAVYSALLARPNLRNLGGRLHPRLEESHLQALEKRGLTGEQIERRGYCTLPGERLIRDALAGMSMRSVAESPWPVAPGFYPGSRGQPRLTGPQGILLPCRDTQQRVVALQVLPDDRSNGKYRWLSSSGRVGGSSPRSPIHASFPEELRDERVWITEGILKADIASDRLGAVVLGLPGKNSRKKLVETLRELGADEVVVALDSDVSEKERASLVSQLQLAGYKVRVAHWDAGLGKGLDNLLVGGGEPQVRKAEFRPIKRRPHKLTAGERVLLETQASRPHGERSLALAEARQRLPDAIREHLTDPARAGKVLPIITPPGVGKSQAYSDVSNELTEEGFFTGLPGERAVTYIPRHDLAESVKGREGWSHVWGRNPRNCQLAEEAKLLGDKGYPVEEILCGRCPHRDWCAAEGYYSQFKRPGNVLAPQEYANLAYFEDAQAAVFDDVSLARLMLRRRHVSRQAIAQAAGRARELGHDTAAGMLEALGNLSEELGEHGILRGNDLGTALVRELGLTLDKPPDFAVGPFWLPLASEQEPEPEVYGEDAGPDLKAIEALPPRFRNDLLGLVDAALGSYRCHGRFPLNIVVSGSGVTFWERTELAEWSKDKPVIVLGATLGEDLLPVAFPSMEILPPVRLDVQAPWVNVIQVTDGFYSKSTLSTTATRRRVLRCVDALLKHHRGEKVGIIAHQHIEDDLKRRMKKRGQDPSRVRHFHALMGANDLADVDVLILAGTPFPNSVELEGQAAAIWPDEPLDNEMTYRLAHYEGADWGVEVQGYSNRRLSALWRGVLESELYQALHRARPLLVGQDGRNSLTVYILSEHPIPGVKVTRLTSISELTGRNTAGKQREEENARLEEACQRLTKRGLRPSCRNLAKEARVTRWRASRWLQEEGKSFRRLSGDPINTLLNAQPPGGNNGSLALMLEGLLDFWVGGQAPTVLSLAQYAGVSRSTAYELKPELLKVTSARLIRKGRGEALVSPRWSEEEGCSATFAGTLGTGRCCYYERGRIPL